MFEYRFTVLLKELLGMLLNPVLMLANLDKNVEKIVDFMRVYSEKHPQLGYVCKFGLFEQTSNITDSLLTSNIGFGEPNANPNDPEIGTPAEYANEQKLQASVKNFHANFPGNDSFNNHPSILINQTKKNATHIMDSTLFDLNIPPSVPTENALTMNSQLLGSVAEKDEDEDEDGEKDKNDQAYFGGYLNFGGKKI